MIQTVVPKTQRLETRIANFNVIGRVRGNSGNGAGANSRETCLSQTVLSWLASKPWPKNAIPVGIRQALEEFRTLLCELRERLDDAAVYPLRFAMEFKRDSWPHDLYEDLKAISWVKRLHFAVPIIEGWLDRTTVDDDASVLRERVDQILNTLEFWAFRSGYEDYSEDLEQFDRTLKHSGWLLAKVEQWQERLSQPQASAAGVPGPSPACDQRVSASKRPTDTKTKKSSKARKGKEPDTFALCKSYLLQHHRFNIETGRYYEGLCLDPITPAELVNECGVSPASVSRFFKAFGSYSAYKRICRDKNSLSNKLAKLEMGVLENLRSLPLNLVAAGEPDGDEPDNG